MKAKDTLLWGLVLLILAAILYAIYIGSTEAYTVTDCQSAYHCETRGQVGCKFYGLQGGHCTFISYVMYGTCGVVSFVGAVMVVVSLYRMVEGPSVSVLPPPPPRPGLCQKCGATNPPTSKYCNGCGTKL